MNIWVSAPTYTDEAAMRAAYAARIARLRGRPAPKAPCLTLVKPEPAAIRPQEPHDAHVRAYADYLAQIAECPSPAAYVRLRSKALGVPHSRIRGNERTATIVAARHQLIKEVKTHYPHLSTSQIGRLFDLDHSTIIYALKSPGPKWACLPQEKIAEIHRLHAEGLSVMAITRAVGVSEHAVRSYVIPGFRDRVRQCEQERRRKAKAK